MVAPRADAAADREPTDRDPDLDLDPSEPHRERNLPGDRVFEEAQAKEALAK
jgi:hypothetical protein